MTVRASYLASNGAKDTPPAPKLATLLRRTDDAKHPQNPRVVVDARPSRAGASRSPRSRAAPRTRPDVEGRQPRASACATAQTTLEVKGVKEGEPLTREQAQAASDELMAQWRKKNPDGELGRCAQARDARLAPSARSGAAVRPRARPPASRRARRERSSAAAPGRGSEPRRPATPTATSPSATRRSGPRRPQAFVERGQQDLPRREGARRHDRGLVRHVPPERVEHAPGDVPEVPGAARPRRAAARHDQLVHREPGARQAARRRRPEADARWRRTSSRSGRACRSSTARSSPLPCPARRPPTGAVGARGVRTLRRNFSSQGVALMKAVVFHGIGDIRLDTVKEPKLVEPTDAIVRLTSSAICGTDLHMVRGTLSGMKPGTILGHEGVGVIEEVGKDVRNLQRRRPGGDPLDDRVRLLLVLPELGTTRSATTRTRTGSTPAPRSSAARCRAARSTACRPSTRGSRSRTSGWSSCPTR